MEPKPDQKRLREEARAFVDASVAPHASRWDAEEAVPAVAVDALAKRGWLGSLLPAEAGGAGLDHVAYGILHEELGRGCASLRAMATVHDMVAAAVDRFGDDAQRKRWLGDLAAGRIRGAFALTEAGAGSDAAAVETAARATAEGFVLDGTKRWVTAGQVADLFLVFARHEDRPTAFLVPRESHGLRSEPVEGPLGLRAARLATLSFRGCAVPAASLLGPPGGGLGFVATEALTVGRYGVAAGAVGLAQACLEASVAHASTRQQFGARLRDHQLVQRLLARTWAGVQSARLLVRRAGERLDANAVDAQAAVLTAKYVAADVAARASRDAVQIHGAVGCAAGSDVQRHFRDAKVLEIIEGSTQILERLLARYAVRNPGGGEI